MLKGLKITFFSYLTKFKVVDREGKIFGHIGDLILKKDLTLQSLIIYGSFIEEKLEDMGIREDIDEIISLEDILHQNLKKKQLKTIKPSNQYQTTGKNWKIPENCLQFRKLMKTSVFNNENIKIGNIIDIGYSSVKNCLLVIRGNFLEGLFSDQDLIIPLINVDTISEEKIKLNISEIQVAALTNTEALSESDRFNKPMFVNRDWRLRFYFS